MTSFAGVRQTLFAGSICGLILGVAILPVPGGADSGPGTGTTTIPQVFSSLNFPSLRLGTKPTPWQTSPAVLASLGVCADPLGGPVKSPIEFDIRITTPDSVSVPWVIGETHEIHLVGRSSSNRFVLTPPLIDLFCAGGTAGGNWVTGGPWKVSDDPIFWVIPNLAKGIYRLHAFDRSTGMCKSSDFSFSIGASPPTPTPTETPSPTNTSTPTETPTDSPTLTSTATQSFTNTPTPTNTIPPPPPTSTNTQTGTPTSSFTPTRTITLSPTPSATNTQTPLPTPTRTGTPTPSVTPIRTPTPTATEKTTGVTHWQEY